MTLDLETYKNIELRIYLEEPENLGAVVTDNPKHGIIKMDRRDTRPGFIYIPRVNYTGQDMIKFSYFTQDELLQGKSIHELKFRKHIETINMTVKNEKHPEREQKAVKVNVVNKSTSVLQSDLQHILDMIKIQADNEGFRYWGRTVDFSIINNNDEVPQASLDVWNMYLIDETEEAGILGYHQLDYEQDNSIAPTIKIFPREVLRYQNEETISDTISHEIMDLIGDPTCNRTFQGYDDNDKDCLYYVEVCDPVAAITYQIGETRVSNLIGPDWFQLTEGHDYDFYGKDQQPFEIRPLGHYEISYDDGDSWQEINVKQNVTRLKPNKFKDGKLKFGKPRLKKEQHKQMPMIFIHQNRGF